MYLHDDIFNNIISSHIRYTVPGYDSTSVTANILVCELGQCVLVPTLCSALPLTPKVYAVMFWNAIDSNSVSTFLVCFLALGFFSAAFRQHCVHLIAPHLLPFLAQSFLANEPSHL